MLPSPSSVEGDQNGGQNGSPPPQRSISDLRAKTDKVMNESLESTRRMVTMCTESNEAANGMFVNLDGQGRILDKIEKNMMVIREDMGLAKGHLDEMDRGCCGLLPCRRSRSAANRKKHNDSIWRVNDDGKIVVNNHQRPPQMTTNGAVGNGNGHGGYIQRIMNDGREDEMEKNLLQMATLVGNLRHKAEDLNSEVTYQNQQIRRLIDQGDANENTIQEGNKHAKQMLKRK